MRARTCNSRANSTRNESFLKETTSRINNTRVGARVSRILLPAAFAPDKKINESVGGARDALCIIILSWIYIRSSCTLSYQSARSFVLEIFLSFFFLFSLSLPLPPFLISLLILHHIAGLSRAVRIFNEFSFCVIAELITNTVIRFLSLRLLYHFLSYDRRLVFFPLRAITAKLPNHRKLHTRDASLPDAILQSARKSNLIITLFLPRNPILRFFWIGRCSSAPTTVGLLCAVRDSRCILLYRGILRARTLGA